MSERKLVYYVATTIDRFIAREDGTADGFVMDGPRIADYLNSLRDYDTVLMGKKTYEAGSLLDQELIDELILKTHPIVFGKGIPLFGKSAKEVGLIMKNATVYPNGAPNLHYTIRYR
jgi:dihydrofolate reductase